MTRLELQTIITTNLGDTRTDTVTQVKNAIDFVGREIARHINWEGSVRDGFIRTTSGRMQYGLEPDVKQILPETWRIAESSQPIRSMDYSSFIKKWPDKKSGTGIPFIVALQQNLPVKSHPASKLRLVSSSALDITQSVVVWGESYGRWVTETISLNTTDGTTGVLSTNEYTSVSSVTLSAVCVGTVTVTSNSTDAQVTYPTVDFAGNITVTSIAIGDLTGNVINPGSKVRIHMDSNDPGDYSQPVRIGGYVTGAFTGIAGNQVDRVFYRETLLTHASDQTPTISVASYSEITEISKGWNSVKTLVVCIDPVGTTNVAQIGPMTRSINYPQVQFFNIPDGKTIQYAYKPSFLGLTNDSDEPPFPAAYHELLAIWGQRIVEGWHDDQKGVVNLSADPRFMSDIRALSGDQQREEMSLTMGSGWQPSGYRRPYVTPITK